MRAQPLQSLRVRGTSGNLYATPTDFSIGPFELTKLSAQISVLMAERSDGGGKNDAIRKSYQNLGTWKTAQNLVRHRGWGGLYSGFHLHLRE